MKKVMIPLALFLFSNSIDVYAGKDKKTSTPRIIKVGDFEVEENALCEQRPGVLYDLFGASFQEMISQSDEKSTQKKYVQTKKILSAFIDTYDNPKSALYPDLLIHICDRIEASASLTNNPSKYLARRLELLINKIITEDTLAYLSPRLLVELFDKKLEEMTSERDEQIIQKRYSQCCAIVSMLIKKYDSKSNDVELDDNESNNVPTLLIAVYSNLYKEIGYKTPENIVQKLYFLTDKVIKDSIRLNVKPDQLNLLVELFKSIYPSVTFRSDKEPSQKKQAHSRWIYDHLNQVLGSKKNAKEVLDGMAGNFSDSEKSLNEYWSCKNDEELADPTLVDEGRYFSSLTSHWKNALYEDWKREHSSMDSNQHAINKKEEEVAELLKLVEQKQNEIRKRNTTLQAQKAKLKSADKATKKLIRSLTQNIEELTMVISANENRLKKLENKASKIREDKKSDAKTLNEKTKKVKTRQDETAKIKKETEEKKAKLIIALEHVTELYNKVDGEGSLARQLGLIQ